MTNLNIGWFGDDWFGADEDGFYGVGGAALISSRQLNGIISGVIIHNIIG